MAVYKPTHRFTGANARSMEYELRKISETIGDIPIGDITAVTAGNGLSGGGASGDVTLALDINELSVATVATGDYVAIEDITDNGSKKVTAQSIADLAPQGDITGVTAGTNLNGGGTSGTVTLNLDTNITGDITFDTDVLAVDTTNDRVGIGTTSPAAPLQVNTTASDAATLILNTTHASSKRCRLQFAYGGTLGWEWGTDTGLNGTTDMYAYNRASGTVVMTMLDDGKVGIGTASPAAPLHVYGSANSGTYTGSGTSNTAAYFKGTGTYPTALTLDGDGSSDDVVRVRYLNAGANKWQINYGADIIWYSASWTERMRLTSAGNVGIGTTSPSAMLEVGGTTDGEILVTSSAGRTATLEADDSGHYIHVGSKSNHAFAIVTNDVRCMTFTTTSRVGIGDTSPAQTLSVAGTASFTDSIQTGSETFTQEPWSGSTIALGNYGGIGTQGSYKTMMSWNWERGTDSGYYHLNVNSYAQAGYYAIGNDGHRWGFNDSYSPVGWPTERMRLTQTGLGIGTASPSALLDVNGSMRAAYNANTASFFGRARIGYAGSYSDYASFSHLDQTGTGYAVLQYSSGATFLNAASGQTMYIRNGNSDRITVYSDGDVNTTGRWGIYGTHHNSYALIVRTTAPTYMTGETYEVGTYANTTVGGNETRITASGRKFRFTSSGRYKTDIEDVVDSYADEVLNLRPVWYRSLCENDRKDWSHWGLIAEEVGEIDQRLAQYQHIPLFNDDGTTQFSQVHATDDDGNLLYEQVEVLDDDGDFMSYVDGDPIMEDGEPLFEVDENGDHVLQIEGVNYNSIVPLLINILKRQDVRIEALEAA